MLFDGTVAPLYIDIPLSVFPNLASILTLQEPLVIKNKTLLKQSVGSNLALLVVLCPLINPRREQAYCLSQQALRSVLKGNFMLDRVVLYLEMKRVPLSW